MTAVKRHSTTKMVPVPSHSIVPERYLGQQPVLETNHLGIEFGGLKAVEDFNLTIGKTEIAGLIGPNGAGKTTVFNLITKVYEPTNGTVLINGKDTKGMNIVQAGSLPYGAQRRLEIVRALATNPSLLLLDEPAAGMNPHETEELMENIIKIRDQFQIAILLIEHDMNLVMGICEGICVLNYGKIIAKGTADDIQNNPVVVEAYLGKRKEEAK